jgi:hypothetical protein
MRLSEIEIIPLLDTLQILDISDEEYFGPNYKEYISNSRLSYINPEQGGSYELYLENPKKESSSLLLGSAVHCLTLQPNDFLLVDTVDRPTAKAGLMADVLYKANGSMPVKDEIIAASNKVNYYKDKMDDKKIDDLLAKCTNYWRNRALFEHNYKDSKELIYLDLKNREILKSCLNSINGCKEIQSLLYPEYIVEKPISLNEQAILIDFELRFPDGYSTIIKFKAKLDNFTIEPDDNLVTLNDLKTTGHIISEFQGSFEKYHYYRQMGVYSYLLSLVIKKYYNVSNFSMKANMLLVSTVPDYGAGVYSVSKKELLRGFEEFKKLLRMAALLNKHVAG